MIVQMKNYNTKATQILKLVHSSGIVSSKDVRSLGIHHEYLRQMCSRGELVRVGRGLYSLPDADITAHHGLALAGKTVPRGVICLLSALRFHEIGTQMPHEVWIAIDRRAAQPLTKHLKMRIMRFSGNALMEGVDEHIIEGVQVKNL